MVAQHQLYSSEHGNQDQTQDEILTELVENVVGALRSQLSQLFMVAPFHAFCARQTVGFHLQGHVSESLIENCLEELSEDVPSGVMERAFVGIS